MIKTIYFSARVHIEAGKSLVLSPCVICTTIYSIHVQLGQERILVTKSAHLLSTTEYPTSAISGTPAVSVALPDTGEARR